MRTKLFICTLSAGNHRVGAFGLDAEARPDVRVVVPQRAVVRAPVVPERDRMGLPAEAHLEIRVIAVLIQIGQDGVALVPRHAAQPRGEGGVDVDQLAARHRVLGDDRLLGDRPLAMADAAQIISAA